MTMTKFHVPSKKAGKRDKTYCGLSLASCSLVYSGGEPYQAITTPEPWVRFDDVCLTCRREDEKG